MRHCSPGTAYMHIRLCEYVLAHGYTPELRSAAEMHCLGTHSRVQAPLVFPVPPNVGLITDGQPVPTGLAVQGFVGR